MNNRRPSERHERTVDWITLVTLLIALLSAPWWL